jgi:hypothetical protein
MKSNSITCHLVLKYALLKLFIDAIENASISCFAFMLMVIACCPFDTFHGSMDYGH